MHRSSIRTLAIGNGPDMAEDKQCFKATQHKAERDIKKLTSLSRVGTAMILSATQDIKRSVSRLKRL